MIASLLAEDLNPNHHASFLSLSFSTPVPRDTVLVPVVNNIHEHDHAYRDSHEPRLNTFTEKGNNYQYSGRERTMND
jgi:hypothetical protein